MCSGVLMFASFLYLYPLSPYMNFKPPNKIIIIIAKQIYDKTDFMGPWYNGH